MHNINAKQLTHPIETDLTTGWLFILEFIVLVNFNNLEKAPVSSYYLIVA